MGNRALTWIALLSVAAGCSEVVDDDVQMARSTAALGTATNVALVRPASMTGTLKNVNYTGADKAVDGNRDGVFRTVVGDMHVSVASSSGLGAYWEVDLGRDIALGEIRFYSETGYSMQGDAGSGSRSTLSGSSLGYTTVTVRKTDGTSQVAHEERGAFCPITPGDETTQCVLSFSAVGVTGRYVRITRDAAGLAIPLYLAEVEVYDVAAPVPPTIYSAGQNLSAPDRVGWCKSCLSPSGTRDGVFTLDVGGDIRAIAVRELGGASRWDTEGAGYWVLGVADGSGALQNRTDGSIVLSGSNRRTLTLFAEDNGTLFNTIYGVARSFVVVVTGVNGQVVESAAFSHVSLTPPPAPPGLSGFVQLRSVSADRVGSCASCVGPDGIPDTVFQLTFTGTVRALNVQAPYVVNGASGYWRTGGAAILGVERDGILLNSATGGIPTITGTNVTVRLYVNTTPQMTPGNYFYAVGENDVGLYGYSNGINYQAPTPPTPPPPPPSSGPVRLGCYTDGYPRVLDGLASTSLANSEGGRTEPGMTQDRCNAICGSAGFRYAGTQWFTYCFCGSSLAAAGAVRPDSECNTPCGGDAAQMCGGAWRNTVFALY